jgi:DNA replication and repair protein RecF
MLQHLELTNFRSHAHAHLDFAPGITLIHGANGAGKTNIIEAIFILSQGKSFLTSTLNDVLSWSNSDYTIIKGHADEDEYEFIIDNRVAMHKYARLNGGKIALSRIISSIPVILFEPMHLQMITGSPVLRRDYMDRVLSEVFPEYRKSLRDFQRILRHRNRLLKSIQKREASEDELAVWDALLIPAVATIQEKRRYLFEFIAQHIDESAKKLSQKAPHITCNYSPSHHHAPPYEELLHSKRSIDIAAGITTVGPHRDDFMFNFNDKEAALFASRGQQRLCILALLLVELQIIEHHLHEKPVFLCDDVLSEIDTPHQEAFFRSTSGYQSIITSTHTFDLPFDVEISL